MSENAEDEDCSPEERARMRKRDRIEAEAKEILHKMLGQRSSSSAEAWFKVDMLNASIRCVLTYLHKL